MAFDLEIPEPEDVKEKVKAELCKHKGNVDSLAAVVILLARGAVGDSAHELVKPHNVVY